MFAERALFWTKFADMNVYCDRLDQLIERLGVKYIGPTHGLPITDVKATVPQVQEGLKLAALMPDLGEEKRAAAKASGHLAVWTVIASHRRVLATLGTAVVILGNTAVSFTLTMAGIVGLILFAGLWFVLPVARRSGDGSASSVCRARN